MSAQDWLLNTLYLPRYYGCSWTASASVGWAKPSSGQATASADSATVASSSSACHKGVFSVQATMCELAAHLIGTSCHRRSGLTSIHTASSPTADVYSSYSVELADDTAQLAPAVWKFSSTSAPKFSPSAARELAGAPGLAWDLEARNAPSLMPRIIPAARRL